jgi:hypothetical protein
MAVFYLSTALSISVYWDGLVVAPSALLGHYACYLDGTAYGML